MRPKQSADNPHDILTERIQWVNFEYQKGRGSKMDLVDYAKRFALMQALLDEYSGGPVVDALTYLLKMGGERES